MTQKELGYIELEWTCQRCGTINPGMKRVCTNCGAPISVDEKLQLPDQQELITDPEKLAQAQKGPSIQCPYCQVLNPADAVTCLQCGGDIQAGLKRQAGEVLGAHDTTAVPDKPCPSCGQLVSANAQRCPHCGGSLVEAKQAAPAAAPAAAKKMPLWMIIAGVILGLACIGSLIAFVVMGNRTSDVEASVSAASWERSIEVLSQQPVSRSDWQEDLPAQAEDVSCQDKYRETSSQPKPKSTEVCGTPYVVDQGSGAGKVVQDCEYEVYASYCSYTVLDWVVVDTVTEQGADNLPQWPAFSLASGQQEGDRQETYQVTFSTADKSYDYSLTDVEEFSLYTPGSTWVLEINTFGQIKEIRSP